MAQMNPEVNEAIELTVTKKWAVESRIVQELTSERPLPKGPVVARWLLSFFLCLALTCSLVITKTSFIALCTHLTRNVTLGETGTQQYNVIIVSNYLLVYLAVTAAYVLQLLRSLWHVCKCKLEKWPDLKASCLCVLSAILESAGVAMLALKVIPSLGLSMSAFTMTLSMVLQVLCQTIVSFKQGYSARFKILYTGASILMLAGLGIFLYFLYDGYNTRDRDVAFAVHPVICLFTLNLAWLPWLLKFITNRGEGVRVHDGSIQIQRDGRDLLTSVCDNTEWKASIILHISKIAATFAFFFIFFYLDSDDSVKFDAYVHSVFLTAWNFDRFITGMSWVNFTLFLLGGLTNYAIVWGICYMNLWRLFLAVPLLLSLPISVVVFEWQRMCVIQNDVRYFCYSKDFDVHMVLTIVATLVLTAGQVVLVTRQLFIHKNGYMLPEKKLFWLPSSFSAAVDSSIVLNCRETISEHKAPAKIKWPSKVFMCTTMYRENAREMRNVLKSLAVVNLSQRNSDTQFESHVFFDSGADGDKLTEFPLQLMSLVKENLDIKLKEGKRVKTPYGIQIQWNLPGDGSKSMKFCVHIKDSTLVKQRKRWSQVMCISYILDFCIRNKLDDNMYILMTDGDVSFTPQAIESLLDSISRDGTIGAVCARIIPEGMGPVVWYQSFEYAFSHWFQKTTENMLGSVICAPGCFSVFRLTALRDVLPKYSTHVESGLEFLIKDQGEDRWLTTLLIQSGWRIRYCQESEVTTSCPSSFENLYRQRRRWLTSVMSNSMLFTEEWKYMSKFNNKVSLALLLYQIINFISALISPSVILLLTCCFQETLFLSIPLSTVIGPAQLFFLLIYTIICFKSSHTYQIRASIVYTFLYILFFIVVVYLSVSQTYNYVMFLYATLKDSFTGSSAYSMLPQSHLTPMLNASHANLTNSQSSTNDSPTDKEMAITGAYLSITALIYIAGGLLHPKELKLLIFGILYMLCLPSSQLLLTIYCICNLNNCTWGLREVLPKEPVKKIMWCNNKFLPFMRKLFFCCSKFTPTDTKLLEDATEIMLAGHDVLESMPLEDDQNDNQKPDIKGKTTTDKPTEKSSEKPTKRTDVKPSEDTTKKSGDKTPKAKERQTEEAESLLVVDDIESTDETVAKRIKEIKTKGVDKKKNKEKKDECRKSSESEVSCDSDTESQFSKEEAFSWVQEILDETEMLNLEQTEPKEFTFWNLLRARSLKPVDISCEMSAKLTSLRNGWLVLFALLNVIAVVLILTLDWGHFLTISGKSHFGIALTVILLLPLGIQFLAMLTNRISTVCSKIARTGYTLNSRHHIRWSFFLKTAENNTEDSGDDQRAIITPDDSTDTTALV